MKLSATIILAVSTLCVATAQVETTTWTGATDSNWETPSNWDNGVPNGTGAAVIGAGVTVTKIGNFDDSVNGGSSSQFTELTVGAGSALSYSGGGDFRGETWSINGRVITAEAVGLQSTTTFNFGNSGNFASGYGMWGNGHAITINGVIDLGSAVAGTLVTRDLFTWSGTYSSALGSIKSSFSEANGRALSQVADNTTPVKPGEYSFFTDLTKGGGFRVKYITASATEASPATLINLGGISIHLLDNK